MYNGRYGNLSAIEGARMLLQDVANNCTWENINADDYDANRLMKTIEGLQMIIHKTGGKQPITWLPFLYKRGLHLV